MGQGWWADLHLACRRLLRQRLHAVAVIVTLALGIGATVALFSVVHGLLLKPLPYPQDERIQSFWGTYDWSQAEFDFVEPRLSVFQSLAAYTNAAVNLQHPQGAEMIRVIDGSARLFDVLGRELLLGRAFEATDQRAGAAPVVVLGHALWRDRYGADPAIIGRSLQLDGQPTMVIGVAAPDFHFPTPEYAAWRALRLDPGDPDYANNGYLMIIGRLADGVAGSLVDEQIQSAAQALAAQFRYPEAWDKSRNAHLTTLRSQLYGETRPVLLLLFGAAGMILLMACSNVAALVLVRVLERRPELALRDALGARRSRLLQQVATETLLLALLAAILAVILAKFGHAALLSSLPLQAGVAATLSLDHRVLWLALALAVACGLGVGLLPAWSVLRATQAQPLAGDRRRGVSVGSGRLQSLLVGAQVILAVVLATGSVLLVRTVQSLQQTPTGLRSERVITADLVGSTLAMNAAERRQFHEGLLRELTALPGIEAAGLTNRLPLRDGGWQGPVAVDSRPDLTPAQHPNVVFRSATPGFFATLGMQLRAGRWFGPEDHQESTLVTVVSEGFAQAMWPDGQALGQTLVSRFEGEPRRFQVVGVLSEVRMFDLTTDNPFVMYIPQAQLLEAPSSAVLTLRSELPPGQLEARLGQLVAALDKRVAIAEVGSMDAVIAANMAEPVQLRFYLGLLAGLALLLSALGVFGVVSHGVNQRRSEYAMRLALGSSPGALFGRVLAGIARPLLLSCALGALLVIALSQLLGSVVHKLAALDPASLAAGSGGLLLVGALAAFLPAWRAARISPAVTLRDH